MGNLVEVYFQLFGEACFDPLELNRLIGQDCTSCQMIGSKNTEAVIPRSSSWILSSGRLQGDDIDVYSISRKIIEQLLPREEVIKEVMIDYDLKACLQLVIWFSLDEEMSTPAIGFDPVVIRFLANLNAYIDMDSYRNWDDLAFDS